MRVVPGQIIGGWKLTRELGQGGNGFVFEAEKDGRVAALKILRAQRNSKLLARFGDEIRAMEKCAGLPGVLPLYDSFLQTRCEGAPPWLAMAIATPLLDAIGTAPNLDQAVTAIRGVAAALVSVHDLDLSHRDIKPANLFLLKGTWAIGDLGLADFDGKESETAPMEKLGPIHYIAPEMLNNASTADGKPADVYSLAKTLWVLGTGQKYPLPGHLIAGNASIAMSSSSAHPRAALLDRLIDAATVYEPERRPIMRQFLQEVDAWLAPPSPVPAHIRPDVVEFKRLLEGRTAKLEANNQVVAIATQRMQAEGLRLRERFREIANELQETLKAAGFFSPSLNIDNYHYGFEVRAAVPHDPQEREYHSVIIRVNTVMSDPAAQRFTLDAWCYHEHSGRMGQGLNQDLLWETRREFLAGGSEEEGEVAAISQNLRDQLYRAIKIALTAAGVLQASSNGPTEVS